jgi:hypothetical protein
MTGVTRTWPVRLISAAALLASGGPAAVISYQHMVTLATRLGAEPLVAYLMPLTSDGVVASASTLIYVSGRTGRRAPWVAWPLLAAGITVTIVCNAAAVGGHGTGGRLLSAWPALAFCGCLEAAVALARMTSASGDNAVSEAPPPSRDTVVRPVDQPEPATVPPQPVTASTEAVTDPEAAARAFLAEGGRLSQRKLAETYGITRPKAAKLLAEMASSNGQDPR